MFVFGGIGHGLVRPHDTERFLQGYGEIGIDPRLLAYYRAAWDAGTRAVLERGGALSHHHGVGLNRDRFVRDALGDGLVLLTPALGQGTRRAALEGLMDLFEPGNIVDLANRFAGRFGPG